MNYQFLEHLKSSIVDLEKQYYKQIYVHDYLRGNTIKKYSEAYNVPYINLNVELSKLLDGVSNSRRPYKAVEYCTELIKEVESNIVCIDFYELLFEPSLKIIPFELFKNISKNKALIVAWRGEIKDGFFIHAEPSHPEYIKYSMCDAIVIK